MNAPRSRPALEPVAAAAGSVLLFLAVHRARPFDLGDEGYLFLAARELAAGTAIHQRFDPIYPAGVFAWFGAWFAAFGAEVAVFRAAAAALVGLACGGIWWLLRPLAGRAVAAAALTAIVALGLVAGAFKLAAMAVVAVALSQVLAARRDPGPASDFRRWLALPAAAGLLAGWREDSAVLLLALSAWAWWRGSRTFARAATWIGAAVAGTLPWVLIFLARGELGAVARHALGRFVFLFRRLADPTEVAWRQGAVAPATFEQLGHALLPALVALPLLLYGFLLLRAWRRPARAGAGGDLLAALLGFAYLPQFVWERPDVPHFRFHAPVLVVALALAVAGSAPRWRGLMAAALAVPILAVAAQRLRAGPASEPRPYPCCAGARAGVRLHDVPPWAGAIEREGGTMIVLGWLPGLYLLEGDGPGTRYLSTFERHLDDSAVEQLKRDLLAPANRWVVVTAGPIPPGAPELLEASYERFSSQARRVLWRRRDPTPAAPGVSAPPDDAPR